jgi:hypothetical protein
MSERDENTAARHAQRVTAARAQAGPTLPDYRSARAGCLDARQTLHALITAQPRFARHRFVTALHASKLR